jgi:4-diphosphocytidyl-2-C-methyl-D-erythritol kinase
MRPDRLVVDARAKVNLFLRVLGRRPDGYHELETLIVPITLADRLELHAHAGPGDFRTLSFSLAVRGEQHLIKGVPNDESNLVARAVARLAEAAGVRGFADVLLEKRIPPAAGLGGGSADAAATLLALNDLWELGLSGESLIEVASSVGSDVPALLAGTGVLARGRGELVERVDVPAYEWAIVPLPFGVSTADAFGWWDEDRGPSGPDPRSVLLAAEAGDVMALGPMLFNDLEEPVCRRHPEVREAKDRLLDAGAAGAIMCGSGPTVAGLLPPGLAVELPGATRVTSG